MTKHAAQFCPWSLKLAARLCVLGLSFAPFIAPQPALAQNAAPVYVDDSVAARETLGKIPELLTAGNIAQAARNLQNLLDTESDRMLETGNDPDFFRSVRTLVHQLLLSNPALLERYRINESDRAAAALTEGDFRTVEHTRLLTPAGLDAALRLSQFHLEAGRFDAARLSLIQLQNHPDRIASPVAAKACAAAAVSIAHYIDREDVRTLARTFARDAKLPEPSATDLALLPRPARASLIPLTPMSQTGPIAADVGGVDPLASVLLGSQFERSRDPADEQLRVLDRETEAPDRGMPWSFATVLGDTVYVNDGVEFTALDRYTLSNRWRSRPPEMVYDESSWDERRGRIYRSDLGASLEDVAGLSVGSGVVVGATGLAIGGNRRGDPRIHAFDAQTGAWLWSLDPTSIDAALESTTVRGEIVIEADTAIIPLRKRASSRRISSAYLLALDLNTGQVRWLRLLATAGSLPSPTRDRLADSPLLDKGLVYQTDSVGVVSCVEAQSGRPVWSRRFRPETNLRGGMPSEVSPVFNVSRPILSDNHLIFIQPGGDQLLAIDINTGDIAARRALATMGEPRVIFHVGNFIVAPTIDRFTILPVKNFDSAPMAATNVFGSVQVRGRASVSDGRLVVPVIEGLTVIDPANPLEPKQIPLRAVGNTVIAPGQLIVTDARRIHSYVTFSTAETLLRERMAKRPTDAEPANDLIRLAYRAGKWDMVSPAADHALGIFDSDPTSIASKLGRAHLFDLLLEAARAGLEDPSVPKAHPAPTTDSAAAIVDRLAQAVGTPGQRVEQLLMQAKVRELAGTPLAAAEAYQQILGDDALSSTIRFPGTIDEITAEAEASNRLKQLLVQTGIASYRTFDDEAQRVGDAARDNPAELESIARHYPAAAVTPQLLAKASSLYQSAGRHDAAIRALARAVDHAAFGITVGRPEHIALHPRLTVDLAESLVKADQPSSAARVLATIKLPPPELSQRMAALATQIQSNASDAYRLPRIGVPTATRPSLLVGWTIPAEAPLLPDRRGKSPEHVIMFNDTESKLALFGTRPDGSFAPAWEKAYEGARPSLIRLGSNQAILYEPSPVGGVIQCLDTVSGRSIWKSLDFSHWFDGAADRRRTNAVENSAQIATPLDGFQRPLDLLVAADENILILAQRSGRLGAVSLADGKRLWAANTKLDAIYDCAVAGDVIAISGGVEPLNRVAGEVLTPAIVVLDAKTGAELHDARGSAEWFGSRLKGAVRWVRPISDGTAVLGLEDGIMQVNLREGRVNWMSDDDSLAQSADGWTLAGDILIVLDRERHLRLINSKTGGVRVRPLDSFGKISENSHLKVDRIGDQITVATDRGVLMYDATGKIVGMDGLGDTTPLLLPQFAGKAIFALGVDREDLLENARESYEVREAAPLYAMDRKNGKLTASRWIVLFEDPTAMNLVDGKIIISAGSISLVVDAPQEP